MTATDAVADVVEDFGEQIADSADIVRDASGRGWGLAGAAFLAGAGIASGLTYILLNRQLKTKYAQLADDEIEEMREHYNAKGKALEAQMGKGELAEIAREKGYASEVPDSEPKSTAPMAVQPPQSVIDSEEEKSGGSSDPRPEPEVLEPEVRNVFRDRHRVVEVAPPWNEEEELKRRRADRPYVIHRDELYAIDDHSQESLTYYAEDDALCNDRDELVDPADRDRLIGEDNLDRFGHGSNDPAIVYIRNEDLEIVYEIVRSPNSYAEEVHGMKGMRHSAWDRGNLERMHRRERDEER